RVFCWLVSFWFILSNFLNSLFIPFYLTFYLFVALIFLSFVLIYCFNIFVVFYRYILVFYHRLLWLVGKKGGLVGNFPCLIFLKCLPFKNNQKAHYPTLIF